MEAFYRLPAIQQKLGVEAQKMEYSLFTYPQAFCFRNQVLSDNVSQHEDIPVICNSPTLEYIRLQRKIGKAVGLLTEFRTLLDREP